MVCFIISFKLGVKPGTLVMSDRCVNTKLEPYNELVWNNLNIMNCKIIELFWIVDVICVIGFTEKNY